MSFKEPSHVLESSVDVGVVCTDVAGLESSSCTLLATLFSRAVEQLIRYAHPGIFDTSVCSHPPDASVIRASRASEAVVVVPSTLRLHATAALRAVNEAACRHEVHCLGRFPLLADAESIAAARCAWHFRDALEHVHIIFVDSIREAVACLSALHSGSTLVSEIARCNALLEGSVRAIARSLGGAGSGATSSRAEAGGSRSGERMGVDGCEDVSDEAHPGAAAAVGSSTSGTAGAGARVRASAAAPPRHFWLQLAVLGNTAVAGPALSSSNSAATRSAGAGAGSSAGAGSAGSAAVRSSATPTLAAAPTFIAIHALDRLMLQHYEETMRKRRADGSLASQHADAATTAAAAVAYPAAASAAAAGPAPLPTAFPSAASASAHATAVCPDAARASGAIGGALANPFALRAAARLLAVASSALSQTDAIWNELDATATAALTPLNAPADASGVGCIARPVYISLLRPRSSLLLSLESHDALKCRISNDGADGSKAPAASTSMTISMAMSGLGQLLARLKANITIIRNV